MNANQNDDQVAQLFRAVQDLDNRRIVQLVGNGVNVNSTDNEGDTPLHIAVVYPLVELIEDLLEHGADVNRVRRDGTSIVYSWARGVRSGECKQWTYTEVLDLLVSRGARVADVDLEAIREIDLLETILQHGNVDSARLLFDDLRRRENQYVQNILHRAVSSHWNEKVLEHLLDIRVFNVNEPDLNGCTALHTAATKRDEEYSTLLLENGADPNSRNNDNETPLIIAARLGDNGTAEVLLSYGADINVAGQDNITLLDLAPQRNAALPDLEKCIIKQVALLESQGQQVNPEYFSQIQNSPHFLEFFNSCKAELRLIKRQQVFDKSITFYKVLINEDPHLFAKNKYLANIIRDRDFVTRYPIYRKRMFLNFIKVRPDQKEHLKVFEDGFDFDRSDSDDSDFF